MQSLARSPLILCHLLVFCSFPLPQANGQEEKFLRYVEYAEQIRELGVAHRQHLERGDALVAERNETLKQLAKTDNDLRLIKQARDRKAFELLEAELLGVAFAFEAQQQLSQLERSGLNDESRLHRDIGSVNRNMLAARNNGQQMLDDLAGVRVATDFLEHQLRIADSAGQLTIQTRIQVIQSLQQTVKEMQIWQKRNTELLRSYLELADAVGVRCQIELKAGLREFKNIEMNPGARFVQAIAHLRLGLTDEAMSELVFLEKFPAMKAVCQAALAEIHFSRGEDKKGVRLIHSAAQIGKTDVQVQIHVAVALQAAGEFEKAEKAWQRVLEIGSQEIQARTAIARLAALHPNLNPKRKMIASENAELACKLSAGETWNCELALAVAESVNGNQQKAIEAAERATELALGSKRLLCQDVRDAIATKMSIPWGF